MHKAIEGKAVTNPTSSPSRRLEGAGNDQHKEEEEEEDGWWKETGVNGRTQCAAASRQRSMQRSADVSVPAACEGSCLSCLAACAPSCVTLWCAHGTPQV